MQDPDIQDPAMRYAARVIEGDVVWIRPEQLALPGQFRGFPLRIDRFGGVEGQDERGVTMVRVFGPWHDGRRWRGEVEIRIPMDQPLALDLTAAANH
jgi:hypothetical protein